MAKIPGADALIIAAADKAIDTDWSTSTLGKGLFDKNVRLMWHFPSTERLAEARRLAATTYDPTVLEKCLHVIQDSYSHAGFESSHMSNLEVDDPFHDWEVTMQMAIETLDILLAYHDRWSYVEEVIGDIVNDIRN